MKKLKSEEAITILEDMKVNISIPKAAVTQIKRNAALDMAIDALLKCSEIPNDSDTISRKAAIDAIKRMKPYHQDADDIAEMIANMPAAQPFHNTTMNEVLKYIDGMPEDVWQEFTACLECRGWELTRRTAKWCGGNFA